MRPSARWRSAPRTVRYIAWGVGDRRPAPICPHCKGSLVEIAKIAPVRSPLICPAPYRSALHASPAMGPLEYYQKLLANGPARPYLHGGLVQPSNFLLGFSGNE
jgi:hypothetical protein